MSEVFDWSALSQKFPPGVEQTKPGKGGSGDITYITARAVMDRLDTVVGPANWADDYRETPLGVVCTLSIRCGPEWVSKSDIGTESGFAAEKGSYTDALKRAAVKWGIGRYLYEDGESLMGAEPVEVLRRYKHVHGIEDSETVAEHVGVALSELQKWLKGQPIEYQPLRAINAWMDKQRSEL